MLTLHNDKVPEPKDDPTDCSLGDSTRPVSELPFELFIADLESRFDAAEQAEKTKHHRKTPPKQEPYELINITFEAKSQSQVDALITILAYRVLRNILINPLQTYCGIKISNTTALHRKTQHHAFKRLWWGIFNPHNKSKYKERRAFHDLNKHSYEDRVDYHLLCLIQDYNCAYDGKVRPCISRLASELNVCSRTVDKSLKRLKANDDIQVYSGKRRFTTNDYFIGVEYQKHPIMYPIDYVRPKLLHIIMNRKIVREKSIALKRWISKHFRRAGKDFAHLSLSGLKKFRTHLKNEAKKDFKPSKDPPRSRGRTLFNLLLKGFKLPIRERFILSSFGEAPLRYAIDDYKAYLLWGKTIDKPIAFLISRCKYHRARLGLIPPKTPAQKFLDFVKGAKSLHEKGGAIFIQSHEHLDRTKSDTLYIKLMVCKKRKEESILYLWRHINGYWVDKRISFKNERFDELVDPFLRG